VRVGEWGRAWRNKVGGESVRFSSALRQLERRRDVCFDAAMDDALSLLHPDRLDVPLDRKAEHLAELVARADDLPATERAAAMEVLAGAHRRLRFRLAELAEVMAEPEEFDEAVTDALREQGMAAADVRDYLRAVSRAE